MLVDYANISLTLQNDGTFQLNAPNLTGQYAYIYDLEEAGDYAERDSVYMIFSSKEAVKNIHQRTSDGGQGKTAYWDSGGEGGSSNMLASTGLVTLTGKEYVCIRIIETQDYSSFVEFIGSNEKKRTFESSSGMTYAWGDYEIPYGVLFNVGTGHGTAPNAISYDASGNVKLPNIDTAYRSLFNGWYTAPTGGSRVGGAGDTYKNQNDYKNTTLYAQWKPSYAVTLQNDGHGTASADKTQAAQGDKVTLTATPDSGYQFKEWQSSDVTVGADNTFTMPNKAVTVKAVFEEIPTASAPTFDVAEGTYTSVQNVTLTSPDGGDIYYTLDGSEPTTASTKYTGAIPVSETTTIKAIAVVSGKQNSPVASATYTINLPPAKYNVTVQNGTTTDTSFEAGTEVTITADAAPSGQTFDKWEVVSGGVTLTDVNSTTTTFTMPANAVEVKATYKAIPATEYSITVNTDGNGTASASATSAVKNTEITLTATANSGYHFKEWQSSDVTVTANKFVMPEKNVIVTAIFEADTPSHTHDWSSDWTKNSTHHWHECTAAGCDVSDNSAKNGYGSHDYDDDNDTTCNTCGYERKITPPTPSHTHDWSSDWTKNGTHHWRECTAAGCDVSDNSAKDGYGTHNYDDENDTTCNDCGYVRDLTPSGSHTHSWSGSWTKTSTHHWHECEGSGTCDITDNAGKNGYGEHDYTDDTDTTCNTCGYERKITPPTPSHTHDWSSDWIKNSTHHWHECTAAGCDVSDNSDKGGYGAHDYTDDKDTTCNTCGYVREITPTPSPTPDPTPTPTPEPTPTPDPTPTPQPGNNGEVIKNPTDNQNGAPQTTLNNPKEVLEQTDILTPGEKQRVANGENAYIWLRVKGLDEASVPADDKTKTEALAASQIGANAPITYLDIALLKRIGTGAEEYVHNVNRQLDKAPKTGDESRTMMWFVIMMISGMGAVILGRRKKEEVK